MWLPNKIQQQVDFLESNRNVGLIYSDAYFLKWEIKTDMKYSDYKPKLKKIFKNSIQNINMYEHLMTENLVIALTTMVRKECFDKVGYFDEKLKYEDYDMWLRIAKIYPIAYIDAPLAYYRIHDTNISNNMTFMITGTLQTILKQIREEPLKSKPFKSIFLLVVFFMTILKNKINKFFNVRRK